MFFQRPHGMLNGEKKKKKFANVQYGKRKTVKKQVPGVWSEKIFFNWRKMYFVNVTRRKFEIK